MINTTTALVLGYKVSPEVANIFRDEKEEEYYDLIDGNFIHSLSAYTDESVIFGVCVMVFPIEEHFAYSLNDINEKLKTIKEDDVKKVNQLVQFFRDKNLLDTKEKPQLYLINQLY